ALRQGPPGRRLLSLSQPAPARRPPPRAPLSHPLDRDRGGGGRPASEPMSSAIGSSPDSRTAARRTPLWRVIALGTSGMALAALALWARAALWIPDEKTLAAMPLPALLDLARRHPASEPVYYTLGLPLQPAR